MMKAFSISSLKASVFFLAIVSGFNFSAAQQASRPKLVVGIVVDQMCYEYLYRYQPKFSKKGFVKLMQNGTHCRNTQYNYVPTYTGPGHASIYTGTTPSNHGIIANDWYFRSAGKELNCVGDSTVHPVGSDAKTGMKSPKNLKANTITDQLKLTYPDSKVISVSIKDRSAILPGGHLSDGSYWYDNTTGGFLTSSFFRKDLPGWVQEFNKKKEADQYMQQTWDTYYPIDQYTESGPDDTPYEHLLPGKDKPVFPYDLKEMTGGKPNYDLLTYTPFANTLLTDFAVSALRAEQLGKSSSSDFLCISYSTPDIVGHTFGPYSVEIEDVYIRLDMELDKLIAYLEKEVGKNNFVLFLTADHAVVPVPQYLMDKNLPGGYVQGKKLVEELRSSVTEKFGTDFIILMENNNIYFDRERIRNQKIDPKEAQDFVKEICRNWKGVKKAYTAYDLESDCADHEWKDMVRRGFRYEDNGDVILLLEPGYIAKYGEAPAAYKGTTHGSSFNYDTHVPLIFYGKGIPKQEVLRRVNITDITATLVPILQLQKPNATTGEPILEIFK